MLICVTVICILFGVCVCVCVCVCIFCFLCVVWVVFLYSFLLQYFDTVVWVF